MNKKSIVIIVLLSLLFNTSILCADGDDSSKTVLEPTIVTLNGRDIDVYVSWVDITDPTIRIDLSLADEKIGAVDSLANLSKATGANETVLTSINGSFFNMGRDSQPVSTLIKGGQIQHIMHTGSVIGFDGDNGVHIEKLGIKIEGAINDQWEWPYSWSAWNINHLFDDKDAIMIFNKYYTGKFPTDSVYAVAVDRNRVIGKFDYIPKIPTNGYIIVTRNKNITYLMNEGDKIDYRLRTVARNSEQQLTDHAIAFNDIHTALGAGPTLVKDGVNVLNATAEGFKVSKLVTTTAKRSMIGVDARGRMALVACPTPITLKQLAAIALELGLKDAINLDGGGSTGLMVGGEYAVKTSRKISNAVVVKRLATQPIRIVLNDIELYFEEYPFIAKGRTMVPLRKILEKLGCQVGWNADTKQVLVDRYGMKLAFKLGDTSVQSGEKSYQMDVPLMIKNGHSFISIRFLTEFFGGKVDWNPTKKIVGLQLPTVEEYYTIAEALFGRESYELALDYYGKVLALHDKHVSALKRSAYIFDTQLNDQRSAQNYYKRALAIFDKDSDTYVLLGNAYRRSGATEPALEQYQQALAINQKNQDAHYGLAQIYQQTDASLALLHYKWLKENSDNVTQVRDALQFIEAHSKPN